MLTLIIAAALTASAPYDRCIAAIDPGAFVKTQTLDCAVKDMDRADAALNARYRVTLGRLSPERQSHLRREERSWITQRRARCLAAARDPIPSPEINRLRCLARETDARTAVLDRIG